jgi:hypothetical protein
MTTSYFENTQPNILENPNLWEHQKTAYIELHKKALCNSNRSNNNNGKRYANSYNNNNNSNNCDSGGSNSMTLLIHMCTGSGKHLLAIIAPFAIPNCKKALVLFHNGLLRDQVDLHSYMLDMEIVSGPKDLPKVGIVKSPADLRDFANQYIDCDIVIASVHSFGNDPARWAHIPRDFFSVVVVDEGHHARAMTWEMPMKHFKAVRVLLTATPHRTDCKPLHAELVFSYKLLEACRDEKTKLPVLVSCSTGQGQDPGTQEILLRTAHRMILAKRAAGGLMHKGILHCSTRKQSDQVKLLCDQLFGHGSCISFHAGLTPETLYQAHSKIKHSNSDILLFVSHCGLLNEGFDHPLLSVSVALYPVRSVLVMIQKVCYFILFCTMWHVYCIFFFCEYVLYGIKLTCIIIIVVVVVVIVVVTITIVAIVVITVTVVLLHIFFCYYYYAC